MDSYNIGSLNFPGFLHICNIIFMFLKPNDLLKLRAVNRSFCRLVDNSIAWNDKSKKRPKTELILVNTIIENCAILFNKNIPRLPNNNLGKYFCYNSIMKINKLFIKTELNLYDLFVNRYILKLMKKYGSVYRKLLVFFKNISSINSYIELLQYATIFGPRVNDYDSIRLVKITIDNIIISIWYNKKIYLDKPYSHYIGDISCLYFEDILFIHDLFTNNFTHLIVPFIQECAQLVFCSQSQKLINYIHIKFHNGLF